MRSLLASLLFYGVFCVLSYKKSLTSKVLNSILMFYGGRVLNVNENTIRKAEGEVFGRFVIIYGRYSANEKILCTGALKDFK